MKWFSASSVQRQDLNTTHAEEIKAIIVVTFDSSSAGATLMSH